MQVQKRLVCLVRYNKKLCRYKFGINYIKDLRESELEANALRRTLLRKLQKGWSVFQRFFADPPGRRIRIFA